MHLDEIHIQNFKLFNQRSFKFHPQFNLVVGVNGSGKTSLLKATVQVLAECMKGVSQDLPFEADDVRRTPAYAGILIRYEKKYPVKIQAKISYIGKNLNEQCEFIEFLKLGETAGHPLNMPTGSEDWGYLIQNKVDKLDQGQWETLPVMAFYRCNRLWKNNGTTPTPFDAATEKESRLAGYDSWFDASADFSSFWRWVIAKHLERLELAEAIGSQVNYEEAIDISHGTMAGIDELQLVNRAVAGCLENARGIRYDLKQKTILIGWNTGELTPFELLSDGQRVTLAMVADIARRACLLNPHLGGEVLEETPGIVLIDELDLHLHPLWQRRIIGDLRRTFPKIQFIATTHSPQLIGQVKPDEILLLDAKETKHPGQSYGMDSNWVLRHIMGGDDRDAKIAARLDGIFEAIEDAQFDEAEKDIAEMRAEIGEHPDLVEAEALISRYTRFSKNGEE